MNYTPGPPPNSLSGLIEYTHRELQRLAKQLKDDAPVVAFMPMQVDAGTISSAFGINWKIPVGNVIRISASLTVTISGILDRTPYRVRYLLNVGTGVVLGHEDAASSASNRILIDTLIPTPLATHRMTGLWYDPISSRHRVLSAR